MPRNFFLIAGLSLLLAACGRFTAPEPQRSPARVTPAPPLSTIAVSLTIPESEIAGLLNAKTKNSLADMRGRPVKCGIGWCHLDLLAHRTGPIAVEASGDALSLRVPFDVEAQMAAPGFLSMLRATAQGQGEADARTAFDIAPDWQLRSATTGTIHVENSHLRIGPLVTNLADMLNDNQDLLSRPLWRLVDKQLAAMRIRPQVEKAWAALAKPIRVSKMPTSWLVLRPQGVRIARPLAANGAVAMSLGLDVRGYVVTADTPPANVIAPLPPPGKMERPSDRFVVAVPVLLPYDEAARLAMASLAKRPPRIAGTAVRFTSLAFLPSGDDVVLAARFCVDPDWDIFGWFASCGAGYLRGTPHFDAARGTIRVTGVHYDIATAGLVLTTMRVLAGDRLGEALSGHLVFDESKEIARLHADIARALATPQGRNVTVSAAITSYGMPTLTWTKDGFLVVFFAEGRVKAALHLERA